MNLKKTSFWKATEAIQKNKKKAAYIMMLDIIFFSTLIMIQTLLAKIGPTKNQIYNQNIAVAISFSISYLAFVILFYSMMKYIMLLITCSTQEKEKFTLKNYYKFTALNITMTMTIFAATLIIIMIIRYAVKPENINMIIYISIAAAALFFYIIINIAQTLFIYNKSIAKAFKQSFLIIFKKANIYLPLLANMLITLTIYLIFAILIYLTLKNTHATQTTFMAYKTAYYLITAITAYAALFLNRLQLSVKLANFKY